MQNQSFPAYKWLIIIVVGLFAVLFNFSEVFQHFVVALGKSLLVLAASIIFFIMSPHLGNMKAWAVGAGIAFFFAFLWFGRQAFAILDSALRGL